MNFSIVFPSRERVDLLRRLLESIANNTADISQVEVLVGIDKCDRWTCRSAVDLEKQHPFVKFFPGHRGDNLSTCYYNPLALQSTGRFVQLLNDDCELTTQNWDVIGLEALSNKFEDNILLGKTHDNTGCPYTCFPVLSREAINVLGWAQHPQFAAWGADIHLDKLFAGVGRIVDCPYRISHHCHHNKTRERDHVNRRMRKMSRYPYPVVEDDIRTLRAAMK